jgi:hypothetical protein
VDGKGFTETNIDQHCAQISKLPLQGLLNQRITVVHVSQVSGTRRRDSFGCGWHGFTETNIDQHCARRFLHSTELDYQISNRKSSLPRPTKPGPARDHMEIKQRPLQSTAQPCESAVGNHYGVLNWDDERRNPVDAVMEPVLRTKWMDTWWKPNRPLGKCYTYGVNGPHPLGNSLRRRFDRMHVRCRSDPPLLVPTTTRLIRTPAIPGLTFQTNIPTTKNKQRVCRSSDHLDLSLTCKPIICRH